MQCPVCKAKCSENDNTCQRCHWEFEIFISDISEHTQNDYHKKLSIAQEKWKKRVSLIQKKGNVEKKAPTEPKAQVISNKLPHSDKTPVPELNRDPFETFEEFADRINNSPPVPSGKVKLIKKDFSFYIGEFPVEINWAEWTQNIKEMPSKEQSYCIHVSPDIAEQLYQSNDSHTLFIKLKSAKEHSAMDCMEIFWNGRPIPVQQYTGIMRPFKNESEADYQNRISSINEIQIGEGTLNKELYDITTGTFPLEIKVDQWFKENFYVSPANPHIIAERNNARDIYEHRRVYPIKAKLNGNCYAVSIERFYLYAKNMSFLIENMNPEALVFTENQMLEPVTKMEFILVPGGTFQMGDIFDDGYVLFFSNNEKPVHDVKLDSFYIGKYPVTQGQWKKVMNKNPSHFKKGDNYPVENLSWNDTQEFIRRLNEMTKDTQYDFRLPTEAEWEYAARSGGKKEKFSGGDHIDDFAWYSKNSSGTTHPVGEKMPNGIGLYDMSGNVFEWCEDNYFKNAYSKHTKENPVYLASKTGSRVLRGGAWGYGARRCRAACRYRGGPSFRYYHFGFRLVSSPRSVI